MIEVIKANCIIIGAGVAGLAIGRQLSFDNENIFVIEKNNSFAEETSSRNSEVIHAGIYYKRNSLKHKLLAEGKPLLYKFLKDYKIPFNMCGKYLISTSSSESARLALLKKNAEKCGLNDLFYDTKRFKDKYPFLRANEAIFSPSTGILDSHAYMSQLKTDFEMNGGHVLTNNTCVEIGSKNGVFEVLIEDKNSGHYYMIRTPILVNCGGLHATQLYSLFPDRRNERESRYVKGDYYSYSGREKVNHLIYPIPEKDGLGVHVTIDLSGQVKFGPSSYEVQEVEYSMDISRKKSFVSNIKAYWPKINPDLLQPSYSGIRPKLVSLGDNDFDVLKENINTSVFISILGYESPGLSASLGLAKYVQRIIKG